MGVKRWHQFDVFGRGTDGEPNPIVSVQGQPHAPTLLAALVKVNLLICLILRR